MKINSVLDEQSQLDSVLLSNSKLSPKGNNTKRKITAVLLLTSLVDAFSILVIYLLMNFSTTGEILYLSKDMELPRAAQGKVIERKTVVKVEKGQFFVDNNEIKAKDLVAELLRIRKIDKTELTGDKNYFESLIIQADRRTKYKVLNNVVLAGSHAGFSEIKFAVLSK